MTHAPARVLVTRAAAQAAPTIAALRHAGLEPVVVPTIEIEQATRGSEIDVAARWLHTYRWVVLTSRNGAHALLASAERVHTQLSIPSWATVGPSTRRALEDQGIEVAFVPSSPDAGALASELEIAVGDRVLVVRGDLAGDALATTLRRRGALVDDVVAYTTLEAPPGSASLLREAVEAGPLAAVVFTSGSTVRGLVRLARSASIEIHDVPAVCIGPETVKTATDAGFVVGAIASTPDPAALAEAAEAVVRQPWRPHDH